MATYVTLVRFTSKGPDSVTDFSNVWERTAEIVSSMNVSVKGVYGLLGPYDMMIVYDADDQKTAARLPLSIGAIQDNISTETWTTIPLDEFIKMGQLFCEWRPSPTAS